MVVSIIGVALIVCYGFGGLLGATGAVMGHIARRRIRTTQEGGGGLALAGIIVGWIAFALSLAFVGLIIVGLTVDR